MRGRLPALLRTHPLLEQLEVHVTDSGRRSATRYTGVLAGAEEALGSGQREVRGESCGEVLDALSFIAALALQRTAGEGGGSPGVPVVLAPPTRVSAFSADVSTPAPAEPTRLGVMALALLRQGISGPALGWGAGIQLGWQTPSWQPWLLLAAYADSDISRLPSGSQASVQHWSTHAVGCPWRWPLQGAFALRPCADLEVGLLTGTGSRVEEAQSQRAPWLSLGLQLRGELVVWRGIELGVWLGGEAPLWRSRFYFRPDVTVFESETVGLRGGSFVGLLF